MQHDDLHTISKTELIQLVLNQEELIKEKNKELKKQSQAFKKQSQELVKQSKETDYWMEKFKQLIMKKYGRKSDQASDVMQLDIFNEAASLDETDGNSENSELDSDDGISYQENITVPEHKRKKGRKPLDKTLPRIQRVYDLTEEEKQCSCGHCLTKIKEIKTEQLDIIPATVRVVEHVRYQYACKKCEETIKVAAQPQQGIPKSMATPGTLAFVLTSKFCDHLPFYRQVAMLQRMGLECSRATFCNWAQRCGELCTPLVSAMQNVMQAYDIGYADETPLQVLKEPDRLASSKSTMWLFAGGSLQERCLIYQYSPSRSHTVPEAFWGDFKGALHTDGYSGYSTLFNKTKDTLTPIVGLHCWAHARRNFMDLVKLNKKDSLAQKAVAYIAKLYAIEKKQKHLGLVPDEIYHHRQRHALPVLEKFKDWLIEHSNKVLPKSGIGKAIAYCLKFWDNLIRYLDDGRYEIDNNYSERAIKPFVIGRKGWLFHDSPKGAEAGAVLYSLIETCKAHAINPYLYLKAVLENIHQCNTESDYIKLLPFNISADLLVRD